MASRTAAAPTGLDALAVPLDTAPMEARLVEAMPAGRGWQFEPKWDGFRCLAFRAGDAVELRAKSGKTLSRYFPDVVAALGRTPQHRWVLDGELVIPAGDGLSFDALQQRLHPAASRVRKLAAESPAVLVAFDMLLTPDGESLMAMPLAARRAALEAFVAAAGEGGALRLSPATRTRASASRWLDTMGGALDGLVAKRLDGPYQPGERAMLKVKRLRTADCVVGGFRYDRAGGTVASLLLGLYDTAGRLDHVGFTTTIPAGERAALTRRLETLIEPPGFTGKAPGGPSRWTTERTAAWQPLRPALVVEVRFDHVTADRFRHGTRLLRWRPDKAPGQCTLDQIAPAVQPPRPIARVLAARPPVTAL